MRPKAMIAKLVIFPVRLYQWIISPLIGPRCRFHPSCSNYFIEAVQKKGVIVGAAKGVWRILRCHPLGRGGYDPVK